MQDQNKNVLQGKIREAEDILDALQKTSFGQNIVEQNPVLVPQNKKNEPQPVEFDSLLREIQKKIGEIVHSSIDSMAEITSKEPIQLLYVSKLVQVINCRILSVK